MLEQGRAPRRRGADCFYGIVTALTVMVSCGQLTAMVVWRPHLYDGIENTTSLTREEEARLEMYQRLVVNYPLAVHLACVIGATMAMVVKPCLSKWAIVTCAGCGGVGVTGFVILISIVEMA